LRRFTSSVSLSTSIKISFQLATML
jgi:hypothetical protein